MTSFVQAWLSRKAAIDQRKFAEKKDAYINLINAVHLSEIARTEEVAKNVGHWGNVCDLVANESVRHQLDGLFSTNPESDGSPHPERPKVLAALKTWGSRHTKSYKQKGTLVTGGAFSFWLGC